MKIANGLLNFLVLVGLVFSSGCSRKNSGESPSAGKMSAKVESLLLAGEEAFAAKDWKKAVQNYTEALESGEVSGKLLPDIYANRGYCLSKDPFRLLDAVDDLSRSISIAPGDQRRLLMRGMVYRELAEKTMDIHMGTSKNPNF